jgi:group I intron endonuclease
MTCGVYKITCKKTGYVYIGASTKLQERFATHKKLLNNRKHSNLAMQYAWDLLGPDNLQFEIIEICNPLEVFDKEIQHYDSHEGPKFSRCRRYYAAKKPIAARLAWSEQAKRQHKEGSLGTAEHIAAASVAARLSLIAYNKSDAGRAKVKEAWTEERRQQASVKMKRRHQERRDQKYATSGS